MGPRTGGPRVGGGALGHALWGFVRAEGDGFSAGGTPGAAAAADDVGVMRGWGFRSWTRSSYTLVPRDHLSQSRKPASFFEGLIEKIRFSFFFLYLC